MHLAKYLARNGKAALGVVEDEIIRPLTLAAGQYTTLTEILEADDPADAVRFMIDDAAERLPLSAVTLLPPIDDQEVWAAGVTYKRSKAARLRLTSGYACDHDGSFEFRAFQNGVRIGLHSGDLRDNPRKVEKNGQEIVNWCKKDTAAELVSRRAKS